MRTALHAAAFVLNPSRQEEKHHMNNLVWHDFLTVAIRLLGDQDAARAIDQYHTYRTRTGLFSLPTARSYCDSSNPWDWWASYGTGVPELQRLAMKVLSQPASASSSEQNWSMYDYVHDKRRNRLKPDVASKLVFVYTSTRACLHRQSYKRHLEFSEPGAVSPASIISVDDLCDGNPSDADCGESDISDEE